MSAEMMRRKKFYDALDQFILIVLTVWLLLCAWLISPEPWIRLYALFSRDEAGFCVFWFVAFSMAVCFVARLVAHVVEMGAALGLWGTEWRKRPARPQDDWLPVSESVKDSLLDSTLGGPRVDNPWPETLPPLELVNVCPWLRARVDETIVQLASIMNQSPQGEVPAAGRPKLRQLFKDLEHDILELGRQLRVESAYNSLPPAEGHWAERYRRMKREFALHAGEPGEREDKKP